MATVYDIPVEKLISKVAEDLRTKVKLEMPEWAFLVKTGAHKERIPENEDWWWFRAASILRKLYIRGPTGVHKLRVLYGGRKNKGSRPEKFYPAGGKIIRAILKEFDQLGFTEPAERKGRRITPKGQSYLDKIATGISKEGKNV